MKTLLDKSWEYTLYQRDDGELLLEVLCGTVATYELTIQFTEQEKKAFEAEGAGFVEKIAEDVRTYPSRYQFRKVDRAGGGGGG